jgi:hypothetical protein
MDNESLTIQAMVWRQIELLPADLRPWVEDHVVSPHRSSFYSDMHCNAKETYWVITEHNGKNDSNYRLVYFDEIDQFGLVVKLKDGRNCCLGFYKSFTEAVESM